MRGKGRVGVVRKVQGQELVKLTSAEIIGVPDEALSPQPGPGCAHGSSRAEQFGLVEVGQPHPHGLPVPK